jgi:hypothetical protein
MKNICLPNVFSLPQAAILNKKPLFPGVIISAEQAGMTALFFGLFSLFFFVNCFVPVIETRKSDRSQSGDQDKHHQQPFHKKYLDREVTKAVFLFPGYHDEWKKFRDARLSLPSVFRLRSSVGRATDS